jgi:hypothetical protein
MWNCQHIEESLSPYFDGLLTDADRRELEVHVASCASCFEVFESVREAVGELRSLLDFPAPDGLVARIMSAAGPGAGDSEECPQVEPCLAPYLAMLVSGDASADVVPSDRVRLLAHLGGCSPCRELYDAIAGGIEWAGAFREYDAPPALMARIIAGTSGTRDAVRDATPSREAAAPDPVAVRETWVDTLGYLARWLMEPRTAMMALTSVLVMGWMSSLAGLRPDIRTLSNPAALYDGVQTIADEVYDEGIRFYYAVPHAFVGEVQARIEHLRDESS